MKTVIIFKALADPTRLKILECIEEGERCICEIIPYTGKSQPNVPYKGTKRWYKNHD